MSPRTLLSLVKETVSDWMDDKAMRLAAALAFYTLLSLAPLLIVAVSVAGLAFGEEAARGELTTQLQAMVGTEGAEAVSNILANAKSTSSGVIGTIVGTVVLLFGASGVFGELQSALDEIWEVKPKPGRGVKGFLRDRFFSLTMVLGVGFLLLVSLVLSTALAVVGSFFSSTLPGGALVWQVVNFVISIGVFTLLFALIFKVIPDVKIAWGDVWIGALVTAVLFTLGKLGLGIYLGRASVTSPFGAAGSVVLLVIWTYYSAQILFLGAEFTQVYARHRGSRITPASNAVVVDSAADKADKAEQDVKAKGAKPAQGDPVIDRGAA
ncbi:MAG: YihY/virulence factor BrkB family protein [Kofleriaceae bacterium]